MAAWKLFKHTRPTGLAEVKGIISPRWAHKAGPWCLTPQTRDVTYQQRPCYLRALGWHSWWECEVSYLYPHFKDTAGKTGESSEENHKNKPRLAARSSRKSIKGKVKRHFAACRYLLEECSQPARQRHNETKGWKLKLNRKLTRNYTIFQHCR